MSFWKPTKDVRDNWNLQQTWIETRVELVLDESNSKIKTLLYEQLFEAIFLNGE